jgi:serine/threonine protein kinase/tetratricopeptide (TPR) repeat protein
VRTHANRAGFTCASIPSEIHASREHDVAAERAREGLLPDGLELVPGAYRVERWIASGGMGQVYHATDVRSGLPVALKLLRVESDAARARFELEARALAGLDHPSIIHVIDYGLVGDDVARRAGEARSTLRPYLVTEWASGGTLEEHAPDLRSWTQIRGVLAVMLRALAHAHARGVIHRDIKPSNVILARAGDERPGWKLADFGIAMVERSSDEDSVFGSRAFMAPEQCIPSSDHHGPWTDLHAVGVVAFFLATGGLPFPPTANFAEVLSSRLDSLLPFHPVVGVPVGFAAWTRALLEPFPNRRYRHAADALHALESLDGPESATHAAVSRDSDEVVTEAADAVSAEGLFNPFDIPLALYPPAPIPRSWRTVGGQNRLDEGVSGISKWRRQRFVGRERECDLLWAALSDVHSSGSAHGIVVRGSEGCGKTALVRRFSDLAGETGAADCASTSAANRADDVLANLLAGLAGAWVLGDRDPVDALDSYAALRGVELYPDERAALGDLFGRGNVPTAEETRGRAFFRLLHAASVERPRIVTVEGPAVPAFARLLDRFWTRAVPQTSRVLFVLAHDDLSEEDASALAAFSSRDRVHTLDLGRLSRAELVEIGLARGLSRDLAIELATVADEQVSFVLDTILRWHAEERLEPSPNGFRLLRREGAFAGSSESWGPTLALFENVRASLLVAAVLGRRVLGHELDRACKELSGDAIETTRLVVSRGLGEPLGRRLEDGFEFTRPAFRRAIVDRATADELERAHRACAAVIEGASATDAERLAEHLLASGELFRAATWWLTAAERRFRASDFRVARAILERRERQLAAHDAIDPKAISALVLGARIAYSEGDHAKAERAARAIADDEEAPAEDRAEATLVLNRMAARRGDRVEELTLADRAVELGGTLRSTLGARIRAARGVALSHGGRHREALDELRDAMAVFREVGDAAGEAHAAYEMATTLGWMSAFAESAARLRDARAMFRSASWPSGEAHSLVSLAHVLRYQNTKLDEARASYEEALELYDRLGSGSAVHAKLGLALLDLEIGDSNAAERRLVEVRAELSRRGWSLLEPHTNLAMAALAAERGDLPTFDSFFEEACRQLEDGRGADHDRARLAERIAVLLPPSDPRSERARALAAEERALLTNA